MKHNPSFQSAECVASAVFWPVCLAVNRAVGDAVYWDVRGAVYEAVYEAVNGARHQSIHRPLPHPNLRLFTAEIQQTRRVETCQQS